MTVLWVSAVTAAVTLLAGLVLFVVWMRDLWINRRRRRSKHRAQAAAPQQPVAGDRTAATFWAIAQSLPDVAAVGDSIVDVEDGDRLGLRAESIEIPREGTPQ